MLSLVNSKLFGPQSATFASFSEPILTISHLFKLGRIPLPYEIDSTFLKHFLLNYEL